VAANSGSFLVIDDPEKSDAILVLAGETDHRLLRALQLLDEGYASRVVFDVSAGVQIYGSSYLQLAQNWVNSQPHAEALTICPISGLSTKAETAEAAECLRKIGARSALIVTSDFHTRRALSVFRKEDPGVTFHVAAAYDATQFGPRWWKHRQWAKTNVDEWFRLLWWEFVDRWW
jgi:uncharacterized SAM-binding protein YcdF (DUF218 family)